MMRTAICPGSFDPVTLGHVDIITRASKMFDRVIVAVLENSAKKYAFTKEKRMKLLNKALAEIPNIEVITFDGLLADCAKRFDAAFIVKGLRAVSDFDYEFQMALINKKLNPEVETVFLTTKSEYMYLSSSVVREVARHNGDISQFVPEVVLKDIEDGLKD